MVITSDLIFNAVYSEHLQKYRAIFDPASDIISIDEAHQEVIVEYGSTITAPELFNVPEGVELDGWYMSNGEQ
jgi:hypothetical protein